VQLLDSSAPLQQNAARALFILAQNGAAIADAIADAGAIFPLVRLLGPGTLAGVQCDAAWALQRLALNGDNADAVAAAGAIPLLVQLDMPGSDAGVQRSASAALHALACSNDETCAAIAAARSSLSSLDLLEARGLARRDHLRNKHA
jgi:hypothetical protein